MSEAREEAGPGRRFAGSDLVAACSSNCWRYRGVDPIRYAFGLLWLDGDDLRGLGLIERVSPPWVL